MAGRLRGYLKRHGGALALGAAGSIALLAVLFGGEAALSRTSFCVSCHSMSYPAEELRNSTHYGALGANPECKDCHIPQGLANFHLALETHFIDGARELFLEFRNDYSDIDQFDARRADMAYAARMNLKRWVVFPIRRVNDALRVASTCSARTDRGSSDTRSQAGSYSRFDSFLRLPYKR